MRLFKRTQTEPEAVLAETQDSSDFGADPDDHDPMSFFDHLSYGDDEDDKPANDGEKTLYRERFHVQFFLDKALKPALNGLLPLILIMLLVAADYWASQHEIGPSHHPDLTLQRYLWWWTVIGVVVWLAVWSTDAHHKSSSRRKKKEKEKEKDDDDKKDKKKKKDDEKDKTSFKGVLPIVPLAILLVIDFLGRQETPNYPTLATPASLWGWTVFGMVVWLMFWSVGVYRAFYIWQHTWLILTESFLKVERPSNKWLNIRLGRHDEIDTYDIHGFKTEKQTLLQQWLFRDSITVSVLVSALEGRGKSPVDFLPYVRNVRLLQEGVEWIIARNNADRRHA